MINEIRAQARALLETGQVYCFIGYEQGTRGSVRPAFIYEPQEVDRLIWDERCTHDLVTYLHQFKAPLRRGDDPPRVGILVKPCDSRSLNLLIHEEQIDRNRIFVIGVICDGVTADGRPLDRCLHCSDRVPFISDIVVGEQPEAVGQEDYAEVKELESKSPAERLAFWAKEFDRCIRCYACRQACPACYCAECMAEQLDPPWMSISIDFPQKEFFHIMRAYHLAGRCSGCNACEEACPMGIRLSFLNRKIASDVEALFDYRTGEDAETRPPLATFKRDEDLLS